MELAERLARSFGLDLETVSFTLACLSAESIVCSTSKDKAEYDDSNFLEISFLDTTLRSAITPTYNKSWTACTPTFSTCSARIGQFVACASETGSYVWEAAFVLLRYIESEAYFPHSVFATGGARHRVLDLR